MIDDSNNTMGKTGHNANRATDTERDSNNQLNMNQQQNTRNEVAL